MDGWEMSDEGGGGGMKGEKVQHVKVRTSFSMMMTANTCRNLIHIGEAQAAKTSQDTKIEVGQPGQAVRYGFSVIQHAYRQDSRSFPAPYFLTYKSEQSHTHTHTHTRKKEMGMGTELTLHSPSPRPRRHGAAGCAQSWSRCRLCATRC